MGRYSFAAQNINKASQSLLNTKRLAHPPPAFVPLATYPPSTRLVRPAKQRSAKAGKRSSRLFKPLRITYEEDRLRWEYFNDHPWELARPRVMLESDGRDHERWDWSLPLDLGVAKGEVTAGEEEGRWNRLWQKQSGRPVNGEAVVQRQRHLMHQHALTESAAYDQARKEFYRFRHAREVEQRVAREEALSTGAYFGLGPLETGMRIEDKMYAGWKEWAQKEIQTQKALAGSAYTGIEEEGALDLEVGENSAPEAVAGSVPGSRGEQAALGGVTVHA